LPCFTHTETTSANNGAGTYRTDCQQGTITSLVVAADGTLEPNFTRFAMREKRQVIEGNGVQGVRFAELASSQLHIASMGGYPQ
jgi:hypothetical protein